MSADLKIYSVLDLGDLAGDETPQGFWFRDDLERIGYCSEVIEAGLIVKESFFSDAERTNLLIDVNYVYSKSPSTGIFDKQHTEVVFYDEDGNAVDQTFSFVREFTVRQQMKLLKKRRSTIRLFVEGAVMQLLVKTGMSYSEALIAGGAFMVKHNSSLNSYEAAGSPQFAVDVQAGDEAWLDNPIAPSTTIRDYIVSEMSK